RAASPPRPLPLWHSRILSVNDRRPHMRSVAIFPRPLSAESVRIDGGGPGWGWPRTAHLEATNAGVSVRSASADRTTHPNPPPLGGRGLLLRGTRWPSNGG